MNSKLIKLYIVLVQGEYQIDTLVQSYTVPAHNEEEAIQTTLKVVQEKWPDYDLIASAGEVPQSQIEIAARALGMHY